MRVLFWGRDWPANVERIATVQSGAASSQLCTGTQFGSYSSVLSGVTCTACQVGPANSSDLCGTSLGVPTSCCYRPTFSWVATPNPQPQPQAGNIVAYPYLSLPIAVGPRKSASARRVAAEHAPQG